MAEVEQLKVKADTIKEQLASFYEEKDEEKFKFHSTNLDMQAEELRYYIDTINNSANIDIVKVDNLTEAEVLLAQYTKATEEASEKCNISLEAVNHVLKIRKKREARLLKP